MERRRNHEPLKSIENDGQECAYIINSSDLGLKFANDFHFLLQTLSEEALDDTEEFSCFNVFSVEVSLEKDSLILVIVSWSVPHRDKLRIIMHRVNIDFRVNSFFVVAKELVLAVFGWPLHNVIRMTEIIFVFQSYVNPCSVSEVSLTIQEPDLDIREVYHHIDCCFERHFFTLLTVTNIYN